MSAKCFRYEAGSLLFAVKGPTGTEAKLEGDRMPLHASAFEVLVDHAELLRAMVREEKPA